LVVEHIEENLEKLAKHRGNTLSLQEAVSIAADVLRTAGAQDTRSQPSEP